MHYRIYRYRLTRIVQDVEREIHPDKHYKLFMSSRGADAFGELTEYRGKKDSVLMHLREYRSDFTGLVGRHSTEREVVGYNEAEDEVYSREVDDDDYPHAAFICLPRLKLIVCSDGARARADTAMSRLHQILLARQRAFFLFEAVKETFDLRKAVRRFRVTEVTFEVLPVNPHSGDLGLKLDESRKKDHIKRLLGKASASRTSPLTLDGGFLTSVQQLQQSGHAKVGFVGQTEDGVEVNVPKPADVHQLSQDEDESTHGDNVGVRINIREQQEYPFTQAYVSRIRKTARQFLESGVDDAGG